MKKKIREMLGGVGVGGGVYVAKDLEQLLIDIGDVLQDPRNPRTTISLQPLITSILEYGIRKPIVVNRMDKMIEAGHQTYLAVKQLGGKQIPVVWVDDDRARAIGFNISDNRTSEVVAEWDESALNSLIEEFGQEENFLAIGFEDKVIEELAGSNTRDIYIKEIDIRKVERVWVLVGIEQARYNEIQVQMEEVGRVNGIVMYTTTECGKS